MGRILDALKQIESRSPPNERRSNPTAPEGIEAFGRRCPHEAETDQPAQVGDPAKKKHATDDGVTSEENAESIRQHSDRSENITAVDWAGGSSVDMASFARTLGVLEAEESGRVIGQGPGRPAEGPAEQYRLLAENILSQLSPGCSAALMFTSPGNGEGKTIMLALVAAMLADRCGGEVLAVDANFHNPALARLFGIEADRGLVDVLMSTASWQESTRKTRVNRLSVLPGGIFPSCHGQPPEGLNLAPLLDELRSRYQLVLFDTASLYYPEVAPLSRFFEATYLVIRLGQTSRGAVRQAAGVVEDCGGRLLGCVLTNVAAEMQDGGMDAVGDWRPAQGVGIRASSLSNLFSFRFRQ